jgi:hypothetical protein
MPIFGTRRRYAKFALWTVPILAIAIIVYGVAHVLLAHR